MSCLRPRDSYLAAAAAAAAAWGLPGRQLLSSSFSKALQLVLQRSPAYR
jgi:hypothetical protein